MRGLVGELRQPHQRARSAEVVWRDRLESSKGVRIVEFDGKLDQEAHAVLDPSLSIVIPIERQRVRAKRGPMTGSAREQGPISPRECWERWFPALASLGRMTRRGA